MNVEKKKEERKKEKKKRQGRKWIKTTEKAYVVKDVKRERKERKR